MHSNSSWRGSSISVWGSAMEDISLDCFILSRLRILDCRQFVVASVSLFSYFLRLKCFWSRAKQTNNNDLL